MTSLQYGSIFEHHLTVGLIPEASYPKRRRHICRCGCRRKITHNVYANGIAMADGCELEAWRMLRKLERIASRREF